MDSRLKKHWIIGIAILLTVLFSACQGTPPVSEENAGKLQELGGDIVNDLQQKILPSRETPEKLVDYGYVISKKDESDGVDAITEFFVTYESGNDSEVTMIFLSGSFVVSRVAFIDGTGYYLRYEYDKANPGEIAVGGQIIDKVDLRYQAEPEMWEMTLRQKSQQIAKFQFKNPVQKEYRLK